MVAAEVDFDVVVVGAGPVGLTLANILGLQGVRTLVVEERSTLIDYPRGVGLDDEALRTFQSIGVVDRVLPHTVPNQILRFFDAKRRILAEMAPPDARFGWPKRNGFVQPLVDAELLGGLSRFYHVAVWWERPMISCEQGADAVTVELGGADPVAVQAHYVVGCDGGRSRTRAMMGSRSTAPPHRRGGWSSTSPTTHWATRTARSAPTRNVRMPPSRSPTESAGSNS